MPLGRELMFDESLGRGERAYIALFGVPINGLRIRARRILPLITGRYRNVLDAGCGQGVFSFALARRLPNGVITGMDIDQGLVDRNRRIAARCGLGNCRFECSDLTRLESPEQYDLVLSVDMLEHLADDEDILRRFLRVLTPGGDLILHVPAYSRRWLFWGWKTNFDIDGHVRPGYVKEALEEKIRRAGFRIEQSRYTYGWLETVTNNISYLITKGRMKNKAVYAFVFPWLLFFSYFGQFSNPRKGAGILIRARKP